MKNLDRSISFALHMSYFVPVVKSLNAKTINTLKYVSPM